MSKLNLDALTQPVSGACSTDPRAVIARLNEAFQGEWSFRAVSYWKEEEEVIVKGSLSAGGQVKQQFGSAVIRRREEDDRPVRIGEDLKAAALDALKGCVEAFGVVLEHPAPVQAEAPQSRGAGNGKAPRQPEHRPGSPRDRLQKAQEEVLKLPNGYRLFQGILGHFGAESLEGLSEDKLLKVLSHFERIYRTARTARDLRPAATGLK